MGELLSTVGWLAIGRAFINCGVVGYWECLLLTVGWLAIGQYWETIINLHSNGQIFILKRKVHRFYAIYKTKITDVMNIISIDNDIIYLYYHEYCPNPSFFKVMFGPLK